jgi:hypothetical protein
MKNLWKSENLQSQHLLNQLGKGSLQEHSCKIAAHLDQLFQRRFFKKFSWKNNEKSVKLRKLVKSTLLKQIW